MKQNTDSQMTRTAKASVLCGGLIMIAGLVSSFAPHLQMFALTFMFALNTGLHFAVWKRSVRSDTQHHFGRRLVSSGAAGLLRIRQAVCRSGACRLCLLPGHARFIAPHDPNRLVPRTWHACPCNGHADDPHPCACDHRNQYPTERRGKTDHGVGKQKRPIKSQQKPVRSMSIFALIHKTEEAYASYCFFCFCMIRSTGSLC